MPANSKKGKQAPKGFRASFTSAYQATKARIQKRLNESPHRSLRLTRRRDYVRPITLPHPIKFIHEVNQTLWSYRRIFLSLMAVYAILYAGLVGVASQDTYSQLVGTVQEAGDDVFSGTMTAIEQAGVAFFFIASGNLSGASTEVQQVIGVFLGLLAWLTTVWLLRNLLAGHKVKMRDGLYNAGAPIIATAIVLFILILQLLPVALAAIGYAAASGSGLIANGGVEAMLFWIAAGLLTLMSLYWISSSLFAMVIVTLPGMYPIKALGMARKVLLSRRLKILLRLIWMAVFLLIVWAVVLIPIILFDSWSKSVAPAIEWLPLVPIVLLLLSTFTIFWVSAYIYLLYRKVVEND